ncbi:MAG TPA: outer membrane beta-barrel protein [Opitutus sp.]|nr:outer membrane beta-barrel protein [Opitutus sp.]
MKTKSLFILLLGFVSLAQTNLGAFDLPADPFFLGLTAGHATLDHDVFNVPTGDKIGRTSDATNRFYAVETGVRLHKYLAVSAAWEDYGDSFHGQFSTSRSLYSTGTVAFEVLTPYRVSVHGFTGALIPTLPLTDRVSLFGKLGLEWWNLRFRYGGGLITKPDETISGHDLLLGGGADVAIVGRWSARLQYEHLNLAMDSYSAGLLFRF